MIKLNVSPYPHHVYFCVGEKDYIKTYRKLFDQDPSPNKSQSGVCAIRGKDLVIGVFEGSGLSTIVHELSHAVIWICEDVGLPITDEGSEAFCYLLGALFDQCKDSLQ